MISTFDTVIGEPVLLVGFIHNLRKCLLVRAECDFFLVQILTPEFHLQALRLKTPIEYYM